MQFSKKNNLETTIRILYVINSLHIGGSEKVLLDNINTLDPSLYSQHILSLSNYQANNSIFHISNLPKEVKVSYIDFGFHGDYSLFGYLKVTRRKEADYPELESIRSIIRSFKPDIIHFHTSPRELRLRRYLPETFQYVFTDHTLRLSKNELGNWRMFLLSRLFKNLYKGFHVIAVSPQILENLRSLAVTDPEKTTLLLSNSIDLSRFTRTRPINSISGLRAVYISRIDNNKGHEDLIRAWSQLKQIPDKLLYLVGPDQLQGKMQKLAQELGCSETIQFTGSVSDPTSILDACNLGIFPSHKEGLPLSLLEKMAMELPLVVSDIPELMAIVVNKKNALSFKCGNFEELAEKIEWLYRQNEMAESLGKKARQEVAQHYNRNTSQMVLDKFYKSLLYNE